MEKNIKEKMDLLFNQVVNEQCLPCEFGSSNKSCGKCNYQALLHIMEKIVNENREFNASSNVK